MLYDVVPLLLLLLPFNNRVTIATSKMMSIHITDNDRNGCERDDIEEETFTIGIRRNNLDYYSG